MESWIFDVVLVPLCVRFEGLPGSGSKEESWAITYGGPGVRELTMRHDWRDVPLIYAVVRPTARVGSGASRTWLINKPQTEIVAQTRSARSWRRVSGKRRRPWGWASRGDAS